MEIAINRTMITPKEYLSPKGETSKAFTVRKMGQVKRKCRLWKREQMKEKVDGQKNDKENTTTIVDGDIGMFMMRTL